VTKTQMLPSAIGIAEQGSSAILVTVAHDGQLLDRRRIDLTRDLPTRPHHLEGSWAVGRYNHSPPQLHISLADAVALVERVREAAAQGARIGLDALVDAVPISTACIAIPACPKLPLTTEECITNASAASVADAVMYRQALAAAAEARGWSVHWYRQETVFREAAAALPEKDLDAFLQAMGRSVGPPWHVGHRLAAAAALATRASG
jgi:hypothetical protein